MTTQSERATRKITTPNGHEVDVHEYLTGGELRKVQIVLMEGVTANDLSLGKMAGNAVAMDKVPALNIYKAQEEALRFLLISVNGGSKELAFESAMNLQSADLDVLILEATEQMSQVQSAEKKKIDSAQ